MITKSEENIIINKLYEGFWSKHNIYFLDQKTKKFHSFGVEEDPDNMSPNDIATQFALAKGEDSDFFVSKKIKTNSERGIDILEMKPSKPSKDYNTMIVFHKAKSMWSAKKCAFESGYAKFLNSIL